MNDVSVIMCTYNGERHVAEQLQTILAQTLQPLEVLVSDDGSTDATLDIVAGIAAQAPVPVTVHRNPERLGYADNFLHATARARGDLIAFSDQDDRWSPRKLETARDALLREDAVLCTHSVGLIDADGAAIERVIRREPQVIEPLSASPWGNWYGFTLLFRADLLQQVPVGERGDDTHDLDTPVSHDRWVYFLATTLGRTVVLEEVLADYRQHAGQLYGGEAARGPRERLQTKLDNGQAQARTLAAVARHRADLLERSVTGDLGTRAVQRWRSLATYLEDSSTLYDRGLGRTRRLRVLLSSIRRGGYRSLESGGLGAGRLGEDALVFLIRLR